MAEFGRVWLEFGWSLAEFGWSLAASQTPVEFGWSLAGVWLESRPGLTSGPVGRRIEFWDIEVVT